MKMLANFLLVFFLLHKWIQLHIDKPIYTDQLFKLVFSTMLLSYTNRTGKMFTLFTNNWPATMSSGQSVLAYTPKSKRQAAIIYAIFGIEWCLRVLAASARAHLRMPKMTSEDRILFIKVFWKQSNGFGVGFLVENEQKFRNAWMAL